MTAEEKFYKRAEELGIEDFNYCKYGHYGVETENGVVVLVHESDDDAFDEIRYPSMKEMSQFDSLREAIFDMYDAIEEFDNETIGALYRWRLLGRDYEENPYPTTAGYAGVYFGATPIETITFEDDIENYKISLNLCITIEEEVEATSKDEAIEKALEKAKSNIGQLTEDELKGDLVFTVAR